MKRKVIGIAITVVIVSILFVSGILFVAMRISNSTYIVKNVKDKPTPEQQQIINEQFNTKEEIPAEDLGNIDQIYDMMHQMANGKIIAEDGQIWGVKPMTKDRIEACKQALLKLDSQNKKLLDILDRWDKGDFSKCVEDHNYIWNHLNGTVGKAVKLRDDSKQ